MAEFNDDIPALEYIRVKGYASYSSLKMVRDCQIPTKFNAAWFDLGTAVHSLLLEHKLDPEVKARLTPDMLIQVKLMLSSLCENAIVQKLLKGSKNEDKFDIKINGLPVIGYIDINNIELGDLKTTKHTSKAQFVKDMEFLQAAIYLKATGKKDFIYIGASKTKPYEVFTFNVNEYPDRLKEAFNQMNSLTKYVRDYICI